LSVVRLCNDTIVFITLETNTCKHNLHYDNVTFIRTHFHME